MARSCIGRSTLLAVALPLLLIAIICLPNVQAQTPLVKATANNESHLLIVDSGTTIKFQGDLTDLSEQDRDNITGFGWRFNRSFLDRPDQLMANHTLYAEGVYNATFYADFNGGGRAEHLVLVIILFEEEDQKEYPTWFFTILGLSEMFAGCYLFYATWRFKQDRIYLHEAQIYLEMTGKK